MLFVNRARELLARTQDLEREVNLLKGAHFGNLAVGAGPYPAELVVGPVLTSLLREHPDLNIRISIDHWLSLTWKLHNRELDLVISEYSQVADGPELNIRPLAAHLGYFLVRVVTFSFWPV